VLAETAPPNKETELTVTAADLHVEAVEAAESKVTTEPDAG